VAELGDEVQVDIRGRRGTATVVRPPFVDRSPR
jgi:glycine cleavage system aminomethyltransferase T